MCLETISVNNDSRETFINRVQKYADDKEELSEEELNTSEFNHSQIDLATHLRYLVLLCDTSDDYSGSTYEVIKPLSMVMLPLQRFIIEQSHMRLMALKILQQNITTVFSHITLLTGHMLPLSLTLLLQMKIPSATLQRA
ncbi:MAG TPA: hypothetical protein PLZ27_05410 [Bacillota bacterium]|nr:hypothetical protein [Clostridiales bacterium]HPU18089.1 hypothetical protein [Bacillota bacterium]